jgi:nucleoside 2-deoxyribosyltransferase
MKIYFASPLFNQAEKDFNMLLTKKLEKLGFMVFLPQRDGADKDEPPFNKMSKEDRRKAMFNIDRDQIFSCDIFLFILDGRVPDEGACVELGIVYTQKYLEKNHKIIIGLQTDIRAAFLGAKLNPMLKIPLEHIFATQDDLIGFLKKIN